MWQFNGNSAGSSRRHHGRGDGVSEVSRTNSGCRVHHSDSAIVSDSRQPPGCDGITVAASSPNRLAVGHGSPHAHHLHPGVCRGSTDGYETGYANGVTVPGSADEHESPGAVDIHSDT